MKARLKSNVPIVQRLRSHVQSPTSILLVLLLWVLPAFSQATNFKALAHPKGADPNSESGQSINNYGVVLVDYLLLGGVSYKSIKVFPTGYVSIQTPPQYAYAANISNAWETGGTVFRNGLALGFVIKKSGEVWLYAVPGKLIQGGGTLNDLSHKAFSVRDKTTNLYSGMWRDNSGHNLQLDYPGSQWTDALGINNSDDVVGDWFDGSTSHGYLYSKGQFSTIDVPGAIATFPTCINNLGHIGGFYVDSVLTMAHGFVLKDGRFLSIDFPSGDTELVWTQVGGLNDKGKLVGTALIANPALLNGIERFAFTASY